MVPLATKRFGGPRNVDVTLSSNTVRLMLCSCRINNAEHMKRFEKCNVEEREKGREERERSKGRRKMEHSIKRNVCHYVRTFIMQIRT